MDLSVNIRLNLVVHSYCERDHSDPPQLILSGRHEPGGRRWATILLVASTVSASAGEVANFVIISSIVMLSVTMDFVQEYPANAAAEKLRESVSVRAMVLRR